MSLLLMSVLAISLCVDLGDTATIVAKTQLSLSATSIRIKSPTLQAGGILLAALCLKLLSVH